MWREHSYPKFSVKRYKNLACGDAHKDIVRKWAKPIAAIICG